MNSKTDRIWPRGAEPASGFCGEDERATVIASYGLDMLDEDPSLAQVAGFAARLCDAPIALVSIVEREHQRFLAREGLDARETPRSTSFCAYAMLSSEAMEVPDARADSRFADNPLVTGAPHIRFYAGAPLVSEEGAPLGALCVIDTEPRPGGLTDLQREGLGALAQSVMHRLSCSRIHLAARGESQRNEERFRTIVDSVPTIAFSTDADGQTDYYNRQWFEFTGLEDDGALTEPGELMHEKDRNAALESWRDARIAGQPFEGESRLRRADGAYRWMLIRAAPLKNRHGKIVRWFGTMTDVDDGHRLSESREMIARELSHRIKNIFAVISGLVAMRVRKRPEAEEFASELGETLRALSRAHDFVGAEDDGEADTIAAMLARLLAPYSDGGDGRITIDGNDCPVGSRAATPLALVFHELATNAAKYGALSNHSGRIAILIEDAEDSILICWREEGGQGASEGMVEGFGSRLVRMAVEGQLGGTLERRWDSDRLEIAFRLSRDMIAG